MLHKAEFQELHYASEIWLGGPLFERRLRDKGTATLPQAMQALVEKLADKWSLALRTGDKQIKNTLETQTPPCLDTFTALFASKLKAKEQVVRHATV